MARKQTTKTAKKEAPQLVKVADTFEMPAVADTALPDALSGEVEDSAVLSLADVLELGRGQDFTMYQDNIYSSIEQYKTRTGLTDEDITQDKTTRFAGLLNSIYKDLFSNSKSHKELINNINLLDYMYNCYIDLCAIYSKPPEVKMFYSAMLGLNADTVSSWKCNRYKNFIYINIKENKIINNSIMLVNNNNMVEGVDWCKKATSAFSDLIKRWYDFYESFLRSAGTVEAIFLLKSMYHYVETVPQSIAQQEADRMTLKQIKSKYS